MAKSMEKWVSTLSKELGESPSPKVIKEVYVNQFQQIMDIRLEPSKPTPAEYNIFERETKPRHLSTDWLFMESPRQKQGRAVKIAHNIKMVEADHKAGKLIRVRAEVGGDILMDVNITGDFFIIPKESISELEEKIRGLRLDEAVLLEVVEDYYSEYEPESPGVRPRDIVNACMKLKKHI